MTRSDFAGTSNDFIYRTTTANIRPTSGSLTFWDAETGGSQYTDLLRDGDPVSSITVGGNGFIPLFQGPDGVTAMWADEGTFGGARFRMLTTSDPAEKFAPLGHHDFSGTSSTDSMFEYASVGEGRLFHLIAGEGAEAQDGLIGEGLDHDAPGGSANVFRVQSIKSPKGVGTAINLETTSGPEAIGLFGQSFSSGTLVKLVQGSEATGPLFEARNDYGGTGNLFQWGVGVGEVSGFIGAAGDLVVQHGTDDKNSTRVAPSAGGNLIIFDQWTGSPDLWFSSAIATSSQSMLLQSGAGATGLGSEDLRTLIELKNGNMLAFFGGTPTTKPTGVPVTAAGIHAALVTLALIAA